MNDNMKFLFSILLSDNPNIMIKNNEKFIFFIIPELELCKGFNQNNKWHIYDVYDHILHVIDGVPKDSSLRLSALFHDVGKPLTYTEDKDGVGHFYGHWNKSNEIFLKFSKINNLDNNLVETVSKLIYYHDINIDKMDEKETNKLINELNKEEIEKLFLLKKSDLLAQSPLFHNMINEYENQKSKILKIRKYK